MTRLCSAIFGPTNGGMLDLIKRYNLFLMMVVYTLASICSSASRVSDKIYSPLQSNHFCGRRMNSTHQMGCTSDLGGNLGVVWIIQDQKDIEHVLKIGPTPPYMVVIKREHYTRTNLLEFKANPDRVAGVVFFDDDSTSRSTPFSPEYTCPNKYSGLYVNDTLYGECKQNQWQSESPISGLLYDDIPYPIFRINETESIKEIETCFQNNNVIKGSAKVQDTYPLCSMQLDSFMLAASNSGYCLNSRSLVNDIIPTNNQRCANIDNYSIFAYYKPANGPLQKTGNETDEYIIMAPEIVKPQSVVMLIAKLSSLSMFSEISPGADSTITSIVTLLAVAEALGRIRNTTAVMNSDRNIVFSLLDSEPFDYTGSSKMVHDMEDNACPQGLFKLKKEEVKDPMNALKNVNLSSIDYIVNLDQMANYPTSNKIYLHADPSSRESSKFKRAAKILEQTASKEKVVFEREDPQLPLPPTSVQEFIKHSRSSKEDQRLLGLVLSNYGKKYSNLFYHSIYDDSHNINQTSKERLVQHITQVSSFVAKSLYQLAFNLDKTDDVTVDRNLVDNMLECYTKNANCSLFTKVWQAGQELPSRPIQTYKDPTNLSNDMNGAITKSLLAYFIGDRLDYMNLTECRRENIVSLGYVYDYVNGKGERAENSTSGTCIRSQVFMTSAQSPAFQIKNNEIIIDERYPAWTVSYNSIRNPVRIYLKPSPLHQWCVFFMGIVVTIMAFIIVHRLKSSVSQLHRDSETSAATLT